MADMTIKGVDISRYQKNIDFEELKDAGVKFVIIRAGLSESVDTELDNHVKNCIKAGLPYGYYWYSYAKNVKQARREAAACLKAISKYPNPQYSVFFDAEENTVANALGKDAMTDVAFAFIDAIENGGYPANIYANPSWMECEYDKSRITERMNIWLAHWTWDPNKKSNFDYGQNMWQWGTINVKGYTVDANLCFVDYPAITEQWYKEHNKKTVELLAQEVLGGLWGNGADRAAALKAAGYDYTAVQAEVNRILKEGSAKKSVDDIAIEVIRGKWGSGEERKERLTAAGYSYKEVQTIVNKILNG